MGEENQFLVKLRESKPGKLPFMFCHLRRKLLFIVPPHVFVFELRKKYLSACVAFIPHAHLMLLHCKLWCNQSWSSTTAIAGYIKVTRWPVRSGSPSNILD